MAVAWYQGDRTGKLGIDLALDLWYYGIVVHSDISP